MSGGDDDLDHLSPLSKLRISRISICRAHMIDLQGLAYKLWTLGSFLVESLPERKQQQAAAPSATASKQMLELLLLIMMDFRFIHSAQRAECSFTF